MIDASAILPLLCQGSAPPPGPYVRQAGFHTLILCAMEYQPEPQSFPGVEVVYAPNNDDGSPPTREQFALALRAARIATARVRAEKRVLVTCMAGRNRSGLVSALTLYMLGMSPDRAIDRVRMKRRRNALVNPHFVRALRNLRPLGSVTGRDQRLGR